MYRVEVTAEAEAQADAAYEWMTEHISPAFASKWYQGLFRQIETLTRFPTRCPLAAESYKFPEQIRELLYGKRRHKHKYRILFTIRDDVVTVLSIYHSARRELEPGQDRGT